MVSIIIDWVTLLVYVHEEV